MVLKTTLCRFSGLRIWPGRGILLIRVDNQQYLFLNKKCKSLYHNRLRPAKLAWTTTYRLAGVAMKRKNCRKHRMRLDRASSNLDAVWHGTSAVCHP
jgi:large subunit ribosomal protein L24e